MSHSDSHPTISSAPALNRWLLGTAAIGSAAAAQAEIVQIDLVGNEASVNGQTFLDNTYADLTGDGVAEFTSSSFYFGNRVKGDFGVAGQIGRDYVRAAASRFSSSSTDFSVQVGNNTDTGESPRNLRGFLPVTFTDARINGGARTAGFLEVRARNVDFDTHVIELVRLVFDDANTEAPRFLADQQYKLWGDIATSLPSKSAKSKIEKKIAALERQIRQLKKQSSNAGPRLGFGRSAAVILRQIASLERQIAALKRKLGASAR